MWVEKTNAILLVQALPAAFSPLGLACSALVFSLIAQICHRPRIAIAGGVSAPTILLLMGNPMVERVLLRPLEMSNVPSGALPSADGIVVLGGVTAPAFPPRPTVHLGYGGDRLTYAAELYREQKAPVGLVANPIA